MDATDTKDCWSGMKDQNEWKIRQILSHRLQTVYTDDIKTKPVIISDNIVGDAIAYFTQDEVGWLYPAKSYMVGICYSRWISEIFGGDFYEILNDKELLFNNDPYFKCYSEDRETYDAIINIVGLNFDQTKGYVSDVRVYFEEEFLLKGPHSIPYTSE